MKYRSFTVFFGLFLVLNSFAQAAVLSTAQQIQQIYIGYLGRAADAAGLDYWTSQVDQGLITVDQIRSNIVNEQEEYAANYGQLSATELATRVYQNLLNRQPDQAGLDYWTGELASGNIAPEDLIIAYINGVSSDDDENILANKLTAAECYTSYPGIYSADKIKQIITALDSSASYSQCPPVANAGNNDSANIGDTIVLQGFGVDIESDVEFSWEQIYGPAVALSSYDIATPELVAVDVSQCISAPLIYRLTVTDQQGAVSTDSVQININRPFPAATNSTVLMKTSLGDMTLELYDTIVPVTVANFLRYTDAEFYDQIQFHRVVSGFIIQAGLVTADYRTKTTGLLNPIVNEASSGLSNLRGSIAMARTSEPDSAQAQFFINQADNTDLDYIEGERPGYAVFGKVTEGIATVDAIAAVATTTASNNEGAQFPDFPTEPVIIESVSCIRAD